MRDLLSFFKYMDFSFGQTFCNQDLLCTNLGNCTSLLKAFPHIPTKFPIGLFTCPLLFHPSSFSINPSQIGWRWYLIFGHLVVLSPGIELICRYTNLEFLEDTFLHWSWNFLPVSILQKEKSWAFWNLTYRIVSCQSVNIWKISLWKART